MQPQMRGQSETVLPEGSKRVLGRDAQTLNIAVGYAIAQAIKSTLGPKGMDKMLVNELGDIIITNDGATILKEINVEHPAAKMLVEVAKTQDEEVGDGTTTAVVLAGELLKNASNLIEKNIHPSIIIRGYNDAAVHTIEELEKLSNKISIEDNAKLQQIASVSMGSKNVGESRSKDALAKLIVAAVKEVADKKDGKYVVDKDYVKIEKKQGGDVLDTTLIKGVLVDKEVVHPGMPKSVHNAKIALVDTAIEIEKTETDARINISSPEQMQAFLEQEEKMLKEMANKIAASGANVLFCQKGIDDVAQHFLAKRGILTARRVKKSDMEKLARATGAKVTTTLDDLKAEDLGSAGLVEERKIAGDNMIFVERCKEPKAVTIFVRGGTEHVVDEVERAIADAIGAVKSVIEDGEYVVGGGSIEMELATTLRKYANKIGGREQMAIQAFADALEVIPRTLSESCGMDPIDTLVSLRAKHEKGGKYYGVNVFDAKVEDMHSKVVEPTRVKKQAVQSASEVSSMILRIDDIIAAKSKPMPPAGAGGMGGMPPGY